MATAELSKAKERTMIEWVGRMLDDGRSPEHMAYALKQPLVRVLGWIDLVKAGRAE